jgi:general secretion pathway protein J
MMTRAMTHSRQAGMTLIEVMIALGILAIIGTMIWTAFAQTSRNRKVIESSLDRYHQVTVAFDKMASDLSMAHLSRNVNQNEKKSLTTEPGFLGRNEDPDRLDFTSFAHIRRYLNAKEGDRCEVGYRVEEDRENRGTYNLMRREAVVVDEDPEKGGKTTVLVEDVVEFDLEYYDPAMDKWEKEWNTTEATGQAGRLPLQVRIYLTIHDEYGKEVKFATQVPLDVSSPVLFSGGGA